MGRNGFGESQYLSYISAMLHVVISFNIHVILLEPVNVIYVTLITSVAKLRHFIILLVHHIYCSIKSVILFDILGSYLFLHIWENISLELGK